MKHDLKIWPQYFCRVKDGSKTFEVRKNDRGFQPGDTVVLREWDPEYCEQDQGSPLGTYDAPRGYTGALVEFRVGYVLPLKSNEVVFSLLPLTQEQPQ